MIQSLKKRQRNYRMREKLHDTFRAFQSFLNDGKKDEAGKFLATLYKTVDTAVKKHIIHHKNGDRKKSLAAKKLAAMK